MRKNLNNKFIFFCRIFSRFEAVAGFKMGRPEDGDAKKEAALRRLTSN